MNNEPVLNTDKELWRKIPNDYYSPSMFVTEQNNIGINVGGWVYVKPVEDWHKLAEPAKSQADIEYELDKEYWRTKKVTDKEMIVFLMDEIDAASRWLEDGQTHMAIGVLGQCHAEIRKHLSK